MRVNDIKRGSYGRLHDLKRLVEAKQFSMVTNDISPFWQAIYHYIQDQVGGKIGRLEHLAIHINYIASADDIIVSTRVVDLDLGYVNIHHFFVGKCESITDELDLAATKLLLVLS